jgi:hypothetical protein
MIKRFGKSAIKSLTYWRMNMSTATILNSGINLNSMFIRLADKKVWHLDAVANRLSRETIGSLLTSLRHLESFKMANSDQLEYISIRIIMINGLPVIKHTYRALIEFLICKMELELIRPKFNANNMPIFGLYIRDRWNTVKKHIDESNIDSRIKVLTAQYFLISEGFDDVCTLNTIESVDSAIRSYARQDAEYHGIEHY